MVFVLAGIRCSACYIRSAQHLSVFLSQLRSSPWTFSGLSACLFLDYSPQNMKTSLTLQTVDEDVCAVAMWQKLFFQNSVLGFISQICFCCLLQYKGNEDRETVIIEKDHFMDDFFQQVKLQFSPWIKDLLFSLCAF